MNATLGRLEKLETYMQDRFNWLNAPASPKKNDDKKKFSESKEKEEEKKKERFGYVVDMSEKP